MADFDKIFLSTLSLRRATLRRSASIWLDRYFYPRSPCGERPVVFTVARCNHIAFLSTLSLRRATSALIIQSRFISYFYPRSPCGERPIIDPEIKIATEFLSTLSLRRATTAFQKLMAALLQFLSTLSLRRATC